MLSTAWGQTDPGLRPGAINGQPTATPTNPLPLSSVAANSPAGVLDFFKNGLTRFQEMESVNGGANNGLGPRFNFNQCSGCHARPTIGGTGLINYPQSTAIGNGIAGPNDTTPTFITPHGPTREARFPFFFNSNGTVNTNAPDCGVETLFTISGLPNAKGCTLAQPNFAAASAAGNLTSSLGSTTVAAFSDLEIHHMGTGLADNVSQGGAGGDKFRTAPLWGLGQRIFLLHDGRTTNLLAAIQAHSSNGSEANVVLSNFAALSASQQQDLLNFLRSL
jgi:CxxC motif-containing protein (DUF1111 family)